MDNVIAAVNHLIRCLNVPVTPVSVKNSLKEHPDFPSLLAISDVLTEWNVPNSAYYVSTRDLTQIPVPFIAHLSNSGGEFMVVTDIGPNHISGKKTKKGDTVLPIDEFEKSFTGNILIATPGENAGDPEFHKRKEKENLDFFRLPVLFTGVLVIYTFGLLQLLGGPSAVNWQTIVLNFTKLIGCVISVLLLIQSIDANNPITQRFCSGKQNNCSAVLSSKGASLFNGALSWSEIGFFYFSGTLILLLFSGNSGSILQALAFINILALPYTLYSIYYQVRVIRQWCILCCTIQFLLWTEFSMLLHVLFNEVSLPSSGEWYLIFSCFLFPVVMWFLVKPFLLRSVKVDTLQQQLNKFTKSSELFNKLLTAEAPYTLLPEADTLMLGNGISEKIITIVTSPFCPPCAKAHEVLERWLSINDSFKLQVIFTTNSTGKEIARHIIGLNMRSDKSLVRKAIGDWFKMNQKDYKTWAAMYPLNDDNDEVRVDQILQVQEDWCKEIGLMHTPTILIDGYFLPMAYRLEETKYFVLQ